MTKSILWLGFGDIAQRSVAKLAQLGLRTTGIARSDKPVPEGATLIHADIGDTHALTHILANDYRILVISLTPGGRTEEHYRKAYYDNMCNVFNCLHVLQLQPDFLVFVSSTSIYGDNNGDAVDELTPPQPSSATAKILWQTEQLIHNSPIPACCVRFSGIYGPQRFHLLKQVHAGIAGDDTWTNRIHVSDCASVIAFLIHAFLSDKKIPLVLLASDNEPVRSDEVRRWLAQKLGLAQQHLSKPSNQRGGANRRCDNQLLRSLGYVFTFPSYKEGFGDIIASYLREQGQQQ